MKKTNKQKKRPTSFRHPRNKAKVDDAQPTPVDNDSILCSHNPFLNTRRTCKKISFPRPSGTHFFCVVISKFIPSSALALFLSLHGGQHCRFARPHGSHRPCVLGRCILALVTVSREAHKKKSRRKTKNQLASRTILISVEPVSKFAFDD